MPVPRIRPSRSVRSAFLRRTTRAAAKAAITKKTPKRRIR